MNKMKHDIVKLREISWKSEFPVFKKFQKELIDKHSDLFEYGFSVTIQKPNSKRLKNNHLNCGTGFENAHIYFRESLVAVIYCQFSDSLKAPEIECLWIRYQWQPFLAEINNSRRQRKLGEITFNRDGHKTLQSCVNELEKLRREIVYHFEHFC